MRDYVLWRLFWGLSLYLEMPEQGGGTQRTGKYCKKVSRWISCTQNGEIPSIFELSLGFSVAKAGAGTKNGDFVEELKIISSTEC